jgi:CDP-6-deoxy-D-xylo-4-hexulose-3-dehydrase
MRKYRYPCTGHVGHEGFAAFLDAELGEPRRNLIAFNRELAQVLEAERLVLVNSGSSANLAAALAMIDCVGKGCHAITSGFTFSTTLSALLLAGLEVTVVDTEPDGFGIDYHAVRRAIGPTTAVVCVTHLLGYPVNLQPLARLCRERDLILLQDCCEGMNLRWRGQPAHRYGTLSTFSFYHPHHLPAHGGGAIVCPDEEWRRELESLTHWGRACTCHFDADHCPAPESLDHFFHYTRPGLNLAMSELNACFGRFQLRQWQTIEDRRRRHFDILYQALRDSPAVRVYPMPADSGTPTCFPITLRQGNVHELAQRLGERGVEVRSLMGGVITRQPAFQHLKHDGLARCQQLSEQSFFVGIHQTLPEEDVRDVAAILVEELHR